MFVEQGRAALDALHANAERLGVRPDVRATSVLALGTVPAPLDLLMMDPPYETGAGAVALDKLNRQGWISPATWISIRSEEHTSELQSLMRSSSAVCCLKKKKNNIH